MKIVKQSVLATCLILFLAQIAFAEIGYITNSNDTLEDVAKKFHVTVDEIMSANELTEDSVIHEGMRLVIPYSSDEDVKTDLVESETEAEKPVILEYKVVRGDCLERIARDQGCDLDTLLEVNDLDRRSILEIGRIIIIPHGDNVISETNPQTGEPAEETKSRYKKNVLVDVNAEDIDGKNLLDLSQLDKANIVIDDPNIQKKTDVNKPKTPVKQDVIKINVIKRDVSLPDKSNDVNSSIKGYLEHEIVRGDYVSKLARKYGVTESSIFKLNGISKRDILRIGRKIKIPVGSNSKLQNEFPKKDDSLITRKLAKRDKLVNKALKYKGVKYRYGGTNLNKGVDCSGLTMKIYEDFGVQLPHSSKAQSRMGKKVEKKNLLPGDIIFFSTKNKGVTHCGIYIGNNEILHASTRNKRVQVDNLSAPYFSSSYHTARRYI